MQTLKIALVQTGLVWENVEANLSHFEKLFEKIKVDIDLILLPEMFTTGFSMNPQKFAVESHSKGFEWMTLKANEHNCVVAGSMMVEDAGKFYNRLFYVFPDGKFIQYDKNHLFSMGGEHKSYSKGQASILVEVNGWKLKPLICYDLRFPETCRNNEEYDVLIFHANWPQRRIQHWDILLQARAIENLSYVVAVNRIGEDGNNINHNGSSQVIDPEGEILLISKDEDKILYANLEKDLLTSTREKFPFLLDK